MCLPPGRALRHICLGREAAAYGAGAGVGETQEDGELQVEVDGGGRDAGTSLSLLPIPCRFPRAVTFFTSFYHVARRGL